MYETFDHTADLGLRIRATDLESVFRESAEALFSVIVDDLNTVEPRQGVTIEVAPEEPEYFLFDWLRELLYRWDTEHQLFCRFDLRLSEQGLRGVAWGEAFDAARHALAHEVKAITYHDLRLESGPDGWLAEIIVDI